VYVSAETFTNEYVAAIQQKRMEEFRGRYRNECDGLLIDDVQFLAGREGTQEEFFHTFNALYQKDIPIVLTSDVLPQNLHGMAERLCSRFASGLVAEVYAPELETRIAILRKKAEQDGVKLDDETAAAHRQRREQRARARGDADEAVDPGEPERPRGDRRGAGEGDPAHRVEARGDHRGGRAAGRLRPLPHQAQPAHRARTATRRWPSPGRWPCTWPAPTSGPRSPRSARASTGRTTPP
jgi:hypothetical protein